MAAAEGINRSRILVNSEFDVSSDEDDDLSFSRAPAAAPTSPQPPRQTRGRAAISLDSDSAAFDDKLDTKRLNYVPRSTSRSTRRPSGHSSASSSAGGRKRSAYTRPASAMPYGELSSSSSRRRSSSARPASAPFRRAAVPAAAAAASSSPAGRSKRAPAAPAGIGELEKQARIASIYLENFPDKEKLVPKTVKTQTFYRDQEAMDDEIQKLKKQLSEAGKEKVNLSTRVRRLETELGRKDRQLEEILRAKSIMEVGGRRFDQMRVEAHLVKSLKRQIRGQEEKVKARDEEIQRLRADAKYTRVAELELELKTYYYETRRLQRLLEMQEEASMTSRDRKYYEEELSKADERVLSFKRVVQNLKVENQRLTDELDHATMDRDRARTSKKRAQQAIQQLETKYRDEAADKDAELASIRSQLETAREQMQSRLKASNSNGLELQKQIESLQRNLQDSAGEKAGMERELERLRQGTSKAATEAAEARHAADKQAAMVQQLREELTEAQRAQRGADRQIDALKLELQEVLRSRQEDRQMYGSPRTTSSSGGGAVSHRSRDTNRSSAKRSTASVHSPASPVSTAAAASAGALASPAQSLTRSVASSNSSTRSAASPRPGNVSPVADLNVSEAVDAKPLSQRQVEEAELVHAEYHGTPLPVESEQERNKRVQEERRVSTAAAAASDSNSDASDDADRAAAPGKSTTGVPALNLHQQTILPPSRDGLSDDDPAISSPDLASTPRVSESPARSTPRAVSDSPTLSTPRLRTPRAQTGAAASSALASGAVSDGRGDADSVSLSDDSNALAIPASTTAAAAATASDASDSPRQRRESASGDDEW